MSRKSSEKEFKRVILDVSGWRKQKEEDLKVQAKAWGEKVLESGKELELEPMSAWQRRVVHLALEELGGVTSDSEGEARDRHIVIRIANQKTQKDSEKSEDQ